MAMDDILLKYFRQGPPLENSQHLQTLFAFQEPLSYLGSLSLDCIIIICSRELEREIDSHLKISPSQVLSIDMHLRRYEPQPGVAFRSAALTELLRALSKYSHFISMVIMQAMMASSTETNALLAFKSSTSCGYSGCLCTTNPFDTWTGTACSGSNSTWDGVTCTSGSVGTISLSGRCLKGGLPMDWAMLTALIDLDLYNNAMTGRLPVEWSSLTNLDYMRLGINSLSLTLPPEWGSLTALTFLSLHENNLNGSLPDLWSNLVNLKVLRLYKNPLTGTIPPSYTSLVNILTSPSPAFTLLHTLVYGSIPAGLAGKVFGNNGDFKLWPNPPALSTSRPPAPTSSPPPLPSPSLHPLTPQPPTPSANPGQSVTLSPPSPPLNPRPTPSPISQPTSATLKIAVGAGLGGGVVLIAGAFLIFFYLKRQKPASTVQEPKFENINDLSDLPPLSQPYSSEFSAITPTIVSGEYIKASRATSQLQSSTGDSSGVVNSSVINLSSFVLPQVRQDIREDLAQIYRNAEIDPDDLEVGESVGRGASGEVTRGVWRGTEVAVKIFYESLVPSSDRMDGFKGEVAMMSRLSHPNIVQLYGYVIQPKRLAIVSEFVHCGSLFDLLHGSDPLDLKRREAIDGQQWLAIALDI